MSTTLAIVAIVPPSPALRARLIERRWASTRFGKLVPLCGRPSEKTFWFCGCPPQCGGL